MPGAPPSELRQVSLLLRQLLRSLGLTRDLREPDEIFDAVLDEGEEITLASNLKLRRGSIHSEPAIELCGAAPYKFAELRELGLINEQINWKQHFFVPSDEASGIEILTSLLDRYPVIAREETVSQIESDGSEIVPTAAMAAANIVDLEQWILATDKVDSGDESTQTINQRLDGETFALETSAEHVLSHGSEEAAIFALSQDISTACHAPARKPSGAQLALNFG